MRRPGSATALLSAHGAGDGIVTVVRDLAVAAYAPRARGLQLEVLLLDDGPDLSIVALEPAGNVFGDLASVAALTPRVSAAQHTLREYLAGSPEPFDAVVYLNVLEHVEDDALPLLLVLVDELLVRQRRSPVWLGVVLGLVAAARLLTGEELLVAVAVVVARRRDAYVRVGFALLVVCLLLSLGARLRVGGQPTGVVLPWTAMEAVPLLQNMVPSRLALLTALFAGLLLAAALEGLWRRGGWGWRGLAVVTAVASLAAIAPPEPFTAARRPGPAGSRCGTTPPSPSHGPSRAVGGAV
jgi:hypothetical protein